ncbi:MAG: TIGR04076 family protein [Butyricicoccus sp.]
MQHKCKITVIDKKCYADLQEQYLADPKSGECPFYHVGDEFVFERYAGKDDFWTMGKGSQCSEAWDCISRYVYTALQGGSIMRNWTNDERMMIACCNDGTRPVIFKIQRLDYQVLYIDGIGCDGCRQKIREALLGLDGVTEVQFRPDFAEVFVERELSEELLKETVARCGGYTVTKMD